MSPQNGKKVNWWFYLLMFVIIIIVIILIIDKRKDSGVPRTAYEKVLEQLRKQSGDDNTVVTEEQKNSIITELRTEGSTTSVSTEQQAQIYNQLRNN